MAPTTEYIPVFKETALISLNFKLVQVIDGKTEETHSGHTKNVVWLTMIFYWRLKVHVYYMK